MGKVMGSILTVGVLGVLSIFVSGCQEGSESPSPVGDEQVAMSQFPISDEQLALIVRDLSQWVNPDELPQAEQRAFKEFCRFLATRRHCDGEIAAGRMTDQEAVDATEPLIDRLAALGKPTEAVMLGLLEARRSLKPEERQASPSNEDPEIFAAIVLWKQKSERAVPLFMELAKDKTLQNRAVFVRGLGRIGDARALDLLRDLAKNDPNADVQKEAKVAIAAITKIATPEQQ